MPPRRIVPQRVVPSQQNAAAASPARSADVLLPSTQQPLQNLNLREQADIATKKLGPGRRIFVDITKDAHVDWHKLLKANGALSKQQKQPAADPLTSADAPALPDAAFKEPARPKNIFSSVIQRLEQAYVMGAGSDSDSEDAQAARADTGGASSGEGEKGEGGTSGKEDLIRDDQYDYDDNFIDDSEFVDYYGGDRRKAKHEGFFVNAGEIEKTGELIDGSPAKESPKKRRKKAAPAADAAETDGTAPPAKKAKDAAKPAGEGTAAAAKPAKRKAQNGDAAHAKQAAAAAAAASVPAVSSADTATRVLAAVEHVVAETRDGFGSPIVSEPAAAPAAPAGQAVAVPAATAPLSGATTASPSGISAAGQLAGGGSAKKKPPADGKPYVLSQEMSEALDSLRNLASKEQPSGPDSNKKIPESIRLALPAFVGVYDREVKKHKSAQSTINSRLMDFLDPFTSRNNLSGLLKRTGDKLNKDYTDAKSALRTGVVNACHAAKAAAAADGSSANTPAHFPWTEELARHLVDFIRLRGQVKGTAPIKSGKIFTQLLDFWADKSLIDAATMQRVYNQYAPRFGATPVTPGEAGHRPFVTTASATPQPSGDLSSGAAARGISPLLSSPAAATPATPAAATPQAVGAPQQQTPASDRLPASLMPPSLLVQALQQASASLPTAAAATGSVAPALLQSSPATTAAPSVALPASEASNQGATPDVAPIDPEPHIAAGVQQGAKRDDLEAEVKRLGSSSVKAVVNLMLMHGGAKGLKVMEIVDKAADMNLGDWAKVDRKSRRNYVSSLMSKQDNFLSVGGWRYSLRAFPGAMEAAVAEQARKNANAAQSAAAHEHSQPPTATTNQDSMPAPQSAGAVPPSFGGVTVSGAQAASLRPPKSLPQQPPS